LGGVDTGEAIRDRVEVWATGGLGDIAVDGVGAVGFVADFDGGDDHGGGDSVAGCIEGAWVGYAAGADDADFFDRSFLQCVFAGIDRGRCFEGVLCGPGDASQEDGGGGDGVGGPDHWAVFVVGVCVRDVDSQLGVDSRAGLEVAGGNCGCDDGRGGGVYGVDVLGRRFEAVSGSAWVIEEVAEGGNARTVAGGVSGVWEESTILGRDYPRGDFGERDHYFTFSFTDVGFSTACLTGGVGGDCADSDEHFSSADHAERVGGAGESVCADVAGRGRGGGDGVAVIVDWVWDEFGVERGRRVCVSDATGEAAFGGD
jgi:hypothetical protein